MTDANDSVQQMQYELMLLSRYQLRPHPRDTPMIERSAYLLLSRLELVDPMTLKELSHALRLDTSTVHRQLGALLRLGYVEYVPGAAGEVARRVAPTSQGLAALVQTRATYEAGLRGVVGTWPEKKRQQLMVLLREFNQDVETMEDAPWPRLGDAAPSGTTQSGTAQG
ncbi:MarR family winged helix-turn-helix transcriptional regulator [Arthrobacter alpinus]|uniref:MarR family winged helix-turn-helix transcriptional regulator n=1 Tax=Arthrobacter alpinus TaxID=656366 RepID=UPI0005C8829D|nr:MarR family winged helix-turn-helix transcriptional regulator [Arthrobacter alpinus]